MFARQLYSMVMFLLDPNYVDPTISASIDPTSQAARELTARRGAQWAINVVDFRDADAIMTPFEYDVNPLDGWQPIDGDPATLDESVDDPTANQRRLVWGCEYPHLVLTETLAFHDTRLIDSGWDNNTENGGKKRDEDGDGVSYIDTEDPSKSDDDDLDQHRLPQGSFFAELYCPFDVNNRYPSPSATTPRSTARAVQLRQP